MISDVSPTQEPAKWEAFYQVMLVALATDVPEAAMKSWRKTMIGRGHAMYAKEFDCACRAAVAFGDAPVIGLMAWMSQNGFAPLFVRPFDHKWTMGERAFIESIKMRGLTPSFLTWDEEALFAVPGPATGPRDLIRLGWQDE